MILSDRNLMMKQSETLPDFGYHINTKVTNYQAAKSTGINHIIFLYNQQNRCFSRIIRIKESYNNEI